MDLKRDSKASMHVARRLRLRRLAAAQAAVTPVNMSNEPGCGRGLKAPVHDPQVAPGGSSGWNISISP